MTNEKACDEILHLRDIMCSQAMNSDERWERLIQSAGYLMLRVPAELVVSVYALIYEAERRRDWWWRLRPVSPAVEPTE